VTWITFISEQWLLISLLIALLGALLMVESKRSGLSLDYHGVTRLLNKEEGMVLDLRDSKDFGAGHIVDAYNIPFAKLAERMTELEKYRSKTIILVDKMGQHTGAAARQLKEKGYITARMRGGMSEWTGQNLPVVKA
jgi:rhodanese-related sulfurtransferase